MSRRNVLTALAAALPLWMGVQGALAQEVTLKIHHFLPPNCIAG